MRSPCVALLFPTVSVSIAGEISTVFKCQWPYILLPFNHSPNINALANGEI